MKRTSKSNERLVLEASVMSMIRIAGERGFVTPHFFGSVSDMPDATLEFVASKLKELLRTAGALS